MKNPDDKKTVDLLPEYDLAGERPPALTASDKARARQERYKAKHGVALTVHIAPDVLAAFEALCIAKDQKKSAVIQRLIETRFIADAKRKR